MDLDRDVEGSLAQALSCLGTNDREVLIGQFQQILGGNHLLSSETCAFFLDMNNWNLQAALGAYYDYGTAQGMGMSPPEYMTHLPSMQFVQDITIGEGESVPPSTRFVKTWLVRNNGSESWPLGCYIGFMEGDKLSDVTRSLVEPLPPGEELNVSVDMVSPATKGIYQSRWQLNTSSGIPFGESIWCIITVDDLGILDITQQLASAPLGSTPPFNRDMPNPFGAVVHFDEHFARYFNKETENKNADMGDSQDSMDSAGFDSPATPNGMVSLSNDTASRPIPRESIPGYVRNWSSLENDGCPLVPASQPINIVHMDDAPDVPPCTPCTPPQ